MLFCQQKKNLEFEEKKESHISLAPWQWWLILWNMLSCTTTSAWHYSWVNDKSWEKVNIVCGRERQLKMFIFLHNRTHHFFSRARHTKFWFTSLLTFFSFHLFLSLTLPGFFYLPGIASIYMYYVSSYLCPHIFTNAIADRWTTC